MKNKIIVSGVALCLLIVLPVLSCKPSVGSGQEDAGQYVKSEQAGERINAKRISGCGPDNIWAAGFEGIYHNDGSSWDRRDYDDNKIVDVYSLDENHVWAVGYEYPPELETFRTYVLFYDGATWSRQFECEGLPWGILALDTSHVWFAAGRNGIYSYDGTLWSRIAAPDDEVCMSVTASDASEVWVGMVSSSIYQLDGTNWTKRYEGIGMVDNLFALDRNHVWATARDGLQGTGYILFYDGENWSIQDELRDGGFTSIYALDPEHVWASANFNKEKVSLGEQGYVDMTEGRVYFFDGDTWNLRWQGYPELLEDLYVQDADHVWATSFLSGVFTLVRP